MPEFERGDPTPFARFNATVEDRAFANENKLVELNKYIEAHVPDESARILLRSAIKTAYEAGVTSNDLSWLDSLRGHGVPKAKIIGSYPNKTLKEFKQDEWI